MKFSRYLTLLTIATVISAAALSAATVVIDPYRIFAVYERPGVNDPKPRAYNQVQWAKAAAYGRSGARAVILGNSRLDVGIDPESPLWPADLQPAYNYAIPGLGIQKVAGIALKAMESPRVRTLVIGLDFLDFLNTEAIAADAVSPFAPAPTARSANDYMSVVASLTAVGDSAATLLAQGNPNAATMTPLGFNPLLNYNDLVSAEGHYALALQRNRENYRNYQRLTKTTLPDPAATTLDYAALAAILDAAKGQGVGVRLLIYPYHADVLEGFERAGLRPAFDQWKRRLADLAAGQAELWDFSGYNAITTERFPAKGDTRTHLRWYWEPGHFKAALGEEMLKRMFQTPNALPWFGVPLTPATVDADLAAYEAGRMAYLAAEPEEAARIDAIFSQIKAR